MAVDGAAADEDIRASPRAAPEHQAGKVTRIAGRGALLSPRHRPALQTQQSATPMNNTRRAAGENDVRGPPRAASEHQALKLTGTAGRDRLLSPRHRPALQPEQSARTANDAAGTAGKKDVRGSLRAAPEHQARKLTRTAGRDGLLSRAIARRYSQNSQRRR